MEPNWNGNQDPWRGQGSGPVRRPVDDGTQAQRPLGSTGARHDMPYRIRQQGRDGPLQQTQPPTQPWQGQPPQWQTGPQSFGATTPQQQPWQAPPPDPFDEPGDAPELAQERSENLYDRDKTFWHDLSDVNLQPTQPVVQPPKRADKHALRWIVAIVAVLVLAGFLVYGTVFRVRGISVQGTSSISPAEVIRLSGISEGMSTLSLNEEAIERGVESNRYLSFVCVDVKLPDQVTIQVRERTPAAVIKYCGILYTADNRGMVLEESFDTEQTHPGLIAVEGLDIRQCEVGKPLILSETRQMNVYINILLELKVMSGMNQIKELDLTDMDNLFLVSTDGYSVRLGSSDGIHAKLRAMLLTLDKLRQEGYGVGTVDVSTPVNPTYIPE